MAISASMVWEVQTTGSDDNGGGFKAGATGTDRTYPTSNPQAIGDLKTDGATLTVMVSATYTFVAGDVGNVVSVNVTDSGGLATVGRYEITSVTGGKATVDRAWASASNAGTAGATAVLGGALATPGQAGKTISTANEGANSQKVFVKSGTYTLSTSTAGPGGPFTNSNRSYVIVEGYETTRGDLGAKPVLDAGAQTSVILWNQQHANQMSFVNLKADGQGGTGNKGFYLLLYSEAWHCEAVDCSASDCYGFDYGSAVGCNATGCYNGFVRTNAAVCSAINSVNDGFTLSGGTYQTIGCLAHNSGNDGFLVGSSSIITNCTSDANARHGFNCLSGSAYVRFINCVASNHSGAGDKGFTGSLPGRWNSLFNCASYNNTTAKDTHWQDRGFVTLTADPYVNQANDDFRPNDTAGGGALLRAAGIGVYGQTDNRDIGAVQHTDPISGYTYGDENPGHVLTTATGAGTYVPIADSDTVDGGIAYGAGEEGTGMTSAQVEAAIAAALANGVNVTHVDGVDADDAIKAAAAAAIAAYDPPTWTEMSSAFSSQFDHIKGFFQVICRSDAAIAIDRDLWVAAINENEGSGAGSFNNATDSKQAIRDNQQTAAEAAIADSDLVKILDSMLQEKTT